MAEEWISITAAAERLTADGDPVDRSTLSRYLKQHGDALALRTSGRSSLVDIAALAAHRRENVRLTARPVSVPAVAAKAKRPATGEQFAGTQVSGTARKALADAELREMDLAERRHELVPAAEVDAAVREAIALMVAAFDRAVESNAATLSVKYGWDERQARVGLKAFARSGLDVFNRETLKILDAMARDGSVKTVDNAATEARLQ